MEEKNEVKKEEVKENPDKEKLPVTEIQQELFECPKCGVHGHFIHSNIPIVEGRWCMICALKFLDKHIPRGLETKK